MPNEKLTDQQYENLRVVYQQLCNSRQAIDDFRAQLLGFLPLATGGGIFLLLNTLNDEAKQLLGPIGGFGFMITLGLYFYELHGILKCDHLIKVGKQIEGRLAINGQYTERPFGVIGFINERFTGRLIYSAVLAAWTFLALAFTARQVALLTAIVVFIVSFVVSHFMKLEVQLEEQPDLSAPRGRKAD
jgi:hypothetical protein